MSLLGKPSLKREVLVGVTSFCSFFVGESPPFVLSLLVSPSQLKNKMNRISERRRSGLICLVYERQMTFTPDIHSYSFVMEELVFKNKKQIVSKLKGRKNTLVWLRKRLVVLRSSQSFFIVLTHAFPKLASVLPFFVSPHHPSYQTRPSPYYQTRRCF